MRPESQSASEAEEPDEPRVRRFAPLSPGFSFPLLPPQFSRLTALDAVRP